MKDPREVRVRFSDEGYGTDPLEYQTRQNSIGIAFEKANNARLAQLN